MVEGLAAAYRPFEQVFLVGLTAGQWPLATPRSPVFDEAERAALTARGLPLESEATWDRLERGLFRVLVAGPERQLTVSWSQLDPGGADTVPSAYVEALGDVARMDGAAEGEEIRHAGGDAGRGSTGVPMPWPGRGTPRRSSMDASRRRSPRGMAGSRGSRVAGVACP